MADLSRFTTLCTRGGTNSDEIIHIDTDMFYV